jgi:putative transposase
MFQLRLLLVLCWVALRLQITRAHHGGAGETNNLDADILAEAQRRLRMLGETANKDCNQGTLRARARDIGVEPDIFASWWRAYREVGLVALKPDWTELGEFAYEIVKERYTLLGVFAEQEYLETDDIRTLADINEWSFATARRWLRRYRTYGLYGLAPEKNPFKWKRQGKKEKRRSALGAINDDDLRETYRRYETIKPLIEKRHVTQAEVEAQAELVGESPRTLRYRLAAYREGGGLAGLIPQERSDKGHVHGISPRMERIIRGIRLSIPNITYRSVRKEALSRAKALGEREPSDAQVRFVVDQIPEPLILLADKRDREFRNKYRLTYQIRFEGVVWQIDQTPVDSLAVDIRRPKYQTSKKDKRVYLSGVIECNSRRILAVRFGYDQANRFNVAAVLRDAIILGGIPDEIWTDHGGEFTSGHVARLLSEFNIHLVITDRAELKGRIERIFGTFNTQLWSEVPGYVGSHTGQRNLNNRPQMTISELETRFWKYLDEDYHRQPHSELPYKECNEPDEPQVHFSPVEYWHEFCFTDHIDPRRLDIFLKDARPHVVGKWGIKHDSRKYWHDLFSEVVGEDVIVRAAPYYENPDEIEVFHKGTWLCTAFAYDSERGQAVKQGEVADAQRNQRRSIRRGIKEGRQDLRAVDDEIAKSKQNDVSQESGNVLPQPKPVTPPSTKSSGGRKNPPRRKGSFIDRMTDDSEVF